MPTHALPVVPLELLDELELEALEECELELDELELDELELDELELLEVLEDELEDELEEECDEDEDVELWVDDPVVPDPDVPAPEVELEFTCTPVVPDDECVPTPPVMPPLKVPVVDDA